MLGGGIMRLAPEFFSFLNKGKDYKHELAMLDKQIELERNQSALRTNEIRTQGDIDQALALYTANQTALKSQMQKTGMKIVDALNFLVRPVTTYYFLLIYGAAKVAMFVLMTQSGISGWEAILKLYDEDDKSILAGILAFWFVGRVLDKKS